MENGKMGLHTLCFLDVKAEKERYMTIGDGLEVLLATEKRRKSRVVTLETLVIGIARAGSIDSTVKAGSVGNVLKHNFGVPPHTLVFPGKLHFMETEALIALAEAPEDIVRRR